MCLHRWLSRLNLKSTASRRLPVSAYIKRFVEPNPITLRYNEGDGGLSVTLGDENLRVIGGSAQQDERLVVTLALEILVE